MDAERVRVAQIKQIRRDVIASLNMAFPGELSYEDLCNVLPLVEEHYIQRDVQYFIDRGYVTWINSRPNAPWKGRRLRLTDKGVDVAIKVNVDPALEP
jgi:hypothetical protein